MLLATHQTGLVDVELNWDDLKIVEPRGRQALAQFTVGDTCDDRFGRTLWTDLWRTRTWFY